MNDNKNTETPEAEQIGQHPLVLLFDGDKAVGAMKAHNGNHGIHITADPKAVIGEPSGDEFKNMDVPNDETLALLQFTSVESIDAVIEHLWSARKYFKENSKLS